MGLLPYWGACFSLYFFFFPIYYFYFPFSKTLRLWATCKGNGKKGDKARKLPEVNFSTHRNISRQAVNRITFIRLLPAAAARVKGLSLCPLCSAQWQTAQAWGTLFDPTDTRHSGGAVLSSQQQSMKQDFSLLYRRWAAVGLLLWQKHGSSVPGQGKHQEPPPHRGCASKTEAILHQATALMVKPRSSLDFVFPSPPSPVPESQEFEQGNAQPCWQEIITISFKISSVPKVWVTTIQAGTMKIDSEGGTRIKAMSTPHIYGKED